MSLKCVNIGVFIILIITSVVYNSNIETNERILLEISKNISTVNDILQNLLKQCPLFKSIFHDKMETTSDKTKLNEFFTGIPDYKFRSKVKIRDPQKFLNETKSYTKQYIKKSKNVKEKKAKLSKKETGDKDKTHSIDSAVQLRYTKGFVDKKILFSDYSSQNDEDASENSHDDAFDSQELTTKNGINHQGQNLNIKKITTPNYGEKLLRGNTEEVEHPQDVEKILVIHLGGTTYPDVKTNRGTSQKVNISSVKNKQQQNTTKAIAFKSRIKTDQNSESEDEAAIQDELLRANTLQVALSDACSKLASRKCKNALKAVLKDVCERKKKCKDTFNLEFSGHAISACDEQFSNIRLTNKKKKGSHEKYFREYGNGDENSNGDGDEYSEPQDQELTGEQFIDYTRQGLDMTCLQALSDVKTPKQTAIRTNNNNIDAKIQKVNKWRDKLEDACRKTFVDKCNIACQSAANKTCEDQKCISAKKIAFQERCKKRCLKSYYHKGSESESETTDSDKDSE